MGVYPSLGAVRARVRRGDSKVVLCREILADLLTPVSAYIALCRDTSESFLLESVEGGDRVGRYSFIGIDPGKVFSAIGRDITITGGGRTRSLSGNPWDVLDGLLKRERINPDPAIEYPFTGGAVGYIGYEAVALAEDRLEPLMKRNDSCPDFYLVFTDTLVVFDNVKRKIGLLTVADFSKGSTAEVYGEARMRLQALEKKLLQGIDPSRAGLNGCRGSSVKFKSNMTPSAFKRSVRRAKQYIAAGDIFQVVLSQKFSRKTAAAPFDIYRALRVLNPSPYMFFFRTGDRCLIGSSPEILVTVNGDRACVRPIAGTRPRGSTRAEDLRFETDLLSDPKERAEHIMLVDLGRNDLGRVCDEVDADSLMTVERYSHVMHIVSNVTGRISRGKNATEVLRAAFPAGTVSGAPKIRAMEIISELEPEARGPYAGSMGYFSYTGDMDMCIVIRTILYERGEISVQAGAGIVADSNPENEYQETRNKARALLKAVEMAEEGI